MRKYVRVLAALTAIPFAANVQAQQVQQVPAVPAGLHLDQAFDNSARPGVQRTYVVQMRREPGLTYTGGVAGFAATAPREGEKYNANASHVQMYTADLVNSHDAALRDVGAAGAKIYSYRHAMNGFAARLTDEQAQSLRGNKKVAAVWEDYSVDVTTNNSPEFLGLLDRKEGLRKRLGLKGEDVIVGILDTGAVQEHPSFSDRNQKKYKDFDDDSDLPRWLKRWLRRFQNRVVYDDPPADWNGICQAGEGWSEDDCNNKLIGARWFVDGFLAGRGSVVEGEFLSPRDSSGHGSHTASTAAGNEVEASLQGVPLTTISGMAPRARVAVYKVCWLSPGATNFSCFFSDSAAATDAAVADGVDVINFSVGTAAAFNDPQDLAFLDATAAGVFVARSAGNDGPGFATTNAGEPWVTSVAASTLDGTGFALAVTVNTPASVAGEYTALEGVITQPLAFSGAVIDDLVAADPIDACAPLNNDIGGKIALIARGGCAFTIKVEAAVDAGASAVLMYTDSRPKTAMGGTATEKTSSIPGVMIDNAIGLALLAEVDAGNAVNVTLSPGVFITEELEGNIMADFSSRGPFSTEGDWIKPDITAPGVRILAANAPDQADGSAGDIFGYLQGTSMSSPHIAGLAALVREAHPDWSPAQIKSALMTTARQDVVKEDGATPADPFDYGAGHVDPNKSVDPGLTYDAGLLDYLAASCGTVTPLISAENCSFVEDVLDLSTNPGDLNLASIGIAELPGTQTVTRTVTAVNGYDRRKGRRWRNRDDRPAYWTAEIEAPPGYDVSVSPESLYLAPGDSASYEVTITNVSAPPGEWRFGSLTWVESGTRGRDDDSDSDSDSDSDGRGKDARRVRSPIAVNAVAIVAPPEVSGAGPSGAAEFDITFGYTGEYTPGVHGLNDATVFVGSVADDPGNSFAFLGPGTTIAFLDEVPEGAAYARWELTDAYTEKSDDIDLYLYYCPNLSCTQIGSSTNATSNEEVSVLFPANDPAIDDPYLVFAHGFQTEDGLPTEFGLFAYSFGIVDDAGNLTITSAPGAASLGTTATISLEWMNLNFGTGFKQLGAISHSDADGVQGLTILSIDNDTGGGICDIPIAACFGGATP